MVFSSTIFLLLFLPIFIGIYFLFPAKFRNFILLLFSLLFYTWGENKLVLLLLASCVIDYICGISIENGWRKFGLAMSIIFNLSILGVFKYLNFTFDNFHFVLALLNIQNDFTTNIPRITLPLGISFYTFQTMSYTIDVYRGHVKASRHFIQFATYVTMFPQLVAGPIVRYSDISRQLISRTTSINKFNSGVERFIIGMMKKVLIANTFALVADSIFEQCMSSDKTELFDLKNKIEFCLI